MVWGSTPDIGQRDIGEVVLTHPGLAKLMFAASAATGKHIVASLADHLPRLTMELGGRSRPCSRSPEYLAAGTTWINGHGMVEPRIPSGCIKASGYGLEFGVEGLKAVAVPHVING